LPDLWNLIVEPLKYPFMVRGIMAALIVGTVAAVTGTFVVLRGMAFFGDALAHAILPGLAVGYLVSGGQTERLFWWALPTAMIAAVGIGVITRRGGIKEDTAIGIVFAGMFALGIAMISTERGYAVDLSHILFGNVLGVSVQDLYLLGASGLVVLLTFLLLYKEFVLMSFDPTLAATMGLRTGVFHYALLLTIATTAVVSLQTVGIALMLAMLVTPAATAHALTRRMMVLAAVIGAASSVVGLYLSFYVELASGAAIVLVATILFALTAGLSGRFRSRG